MVYKLEIYVPTDHADAVKRAVAGAGAGKLGNYDSCIWETAGRGQFRPLVGSAPYLGSEGKLETVAETKLEMIVELARLSAVIAALREAHPYETPAFQYWPVETEAER